MIDMRNLFIKKKVYFLFAALGMGLFFSCDDSTHDFTKKTGADAANDVYIADTEFNFSISRNGDLGINGADTILAKFLVYSSLPAESDIKVSLVTDNDLVAVYNAQHGTGYMPIQSNYITFVKQTVTIAKGEKSSTDSIIVYYNKNVKDLANTNGYVVPIKIRAVGGADVKIRYEERMTYLVINVVDKPETVLDGDSELGTQMTDRSKYKVVEILNDMTPASASLGFENFYLYTI